MFMTDYTQIYSLSEIPMTSYEVPALNQPVTVPWHENTNGQATYSLASIGQIFMDEKSDDKWFLQDEADAFLNLFEEVPPVDLSAFSDIGFYFYKFFSRIHDCISTVFPFIQNNEIQISIVSSESVNLRKENKDSISIDESDINTAINKRMTTNFGQIVLDAVIAILLGGGGIAAGLLIAKSIRQNSVQESTPTVSTTAVSNPNQAKLEKASAAYTTILREYMRSELYYTDPYDGPMYDLADMNQDGIPELVISYCSYGNCKVYSFVNDAATCLIENGGENGQIAYFPSQQLVIDFWNQEGSTDVNIYSFTKSEFRLLQSMESAWDEPTFYKIDGNNVSESEFTRILLQYENNMASAKYVGRQYSFPASPEQLTLTIAAK